MAGLPASVDQPVKTNNLWTIACWTELLLLTHDLSVRFTPRFRQLLLVVLEVRSSTFNELLDIDYALILVDQCVYMSLQRFVLYFQLLDICIHWFSKLHAPRPA